MYSCIHITYIYNTYMHACTHALGSSAMQTSYGHTEGWGDGIRRKATNMSAA